MIGPQVRRLRTVSRWSQSDLAAACQRNGWDVGRDIIARIEAGLRQVTDHEIVILARIIGVTVSELVGENALPAKNEALAALLLGRRALRTESVVSTLMPPS